MFKEMFRKSSGAGCRVPAINSDKNTFLWSSTGSVKFTQVSLKQMPRLEDDDPLDHAAQTYILLNLLVRFLYLRTVFI